MHQLITPYDYLLLPFYLILFLFIIKKKSAKYKASGLKKYFITAFLLRMTGAILLSLLIQYYYGYGDSFGYYLGSDVIINMIKINITSLKYFFYSGNEIVDAATAMGLGDVIPMSMPNDSNVFIMKISALVSFFTFNKYLIISLVFGCFSFIGIWKLFYVLNEINKRKNTRLLAFAVLYTPSLWFWGSGLMKESICIGALGISIYHLYKIFILKKYSIKDILYVLLFFYIITVVKSYITIIFFASVSFILFYKLITGIKNFFFRIGVICLCIFFVVLAFTVIDVSSLVQDAVNVSYGQIEVFKNSYEAVQGADESSKAGFMISDIDPSLKSILLHIPEVIVSGLFRPFIWEAKKIIIFFASLEALITLLATLYIFWKTKFIGFFIYVFANPSLLFCFIFSLLFSLVIGFTTFNFGTLVRYKIMFLPFYFFLLISIYGKNKEARLAKKLN